MLWYKKSFSEKKQHQLYPTTAEEDSPTVLITVSITLFLNSKHEPNNDVMVMGYIW